MDLIKIRDKGGQIEAFLLFMIGVVMFIIGFSLADSMIKNSNQVRENLNCNNSSIDASQKITCGVVDIVAPWFIGLVFGLAGVTIGARLIL